MRTLPNTGRALQQPYGLSPICFACSATATRPPTASTDLPYVGALMADDHRHASWPAGCGQCRARTTPSVARRPDGATFRQGRFHGLPSPAAIMMTPSPGNGGRQGVVDAMNEVIRFSPIRNRQGCRVEPRSTDLHACNRVVLIDVHGLPPAGEWYLTTIQ